MKASINENAGSAGGIAATIAFMRASALLVLTCAVVTTALAVPGCGSDEKPEEKKQGDSIECAGRVCNSAVLPQGYPPIEACCAEGDACGLDGAPFEEYGLVFEDSCQARDQPGDLDLDCPRSMPVPTDFGDLDFPGCCTPAGLCGYLVDSAFGFISIGLGCVESTPFLDGGTPEPCTPGSDGGGGAGGAG
jgi:hypothetical protein